MMNILIIDDDPQNISLSRLILTRLLGKEIEIIDFTDPEIAIQYIESNYANRNDKLKSTVFLDINMGSMNGLEFLNRFDSNPFRIKKMLDIYILSSSINEAEIDLYKSNKNVIDFIEKPLNKHTIAKIFKTK